MIEIKDGKILYSYPDILGDEGDAILPLLSDRFVTLKDMEAQIIVRDTIIIRAKSEDDINLIII